MTRNLYEPKAVASAARPSRTRSTTERMDQVEEVKGETTEASASESARP